MEGSTKWWGYSHGPREDKDASGRGDEDIVNEDDCWLRKHKATDHGKILKRDIIGTGICGTQVRVHPIYTKNIVVINKVEKFRIHLGIIDNTVLYSYKNVWTRHDSR